MRARADFRPARRKPPEAAMLKELAALCSSRPMGLQPPAAPPLQPAGVFRWIVDIEAWKPTKAEWAFLLSQLPEAESTKVMKFLQEPDRKRALTSRLLQRRACYETTGLPWDAIRIDRTKGGKPFMANKPDPKATGMRVPSNWNFNVSHEGKYVVLAAEPLVVVGVDVAAPFDARPGRKQTIEDHMRVFDDQLTAAEKKSFSRRRRSTGYSSAH